MMFYINYTFLKSGTDVC